MIVDPPDTPDLAKRMEVRVFCDATDNLLAIKEISAWAAERGFVRTNESNLNIVYRGGKTLRVGFCYRLTDEQNASAEADIARIRQRIDKMAPTAPSAELLREARG